MILETADSESVSEIILTLMGRCVNFTLCWVCHGSRGHNFRKVSKISYNTNELLKKKLTRMCQFFLSNRWTVIYFQNQIASFLGGMDRYTVSKYKVIYYCTHWYVCGCAYIWCTLLNLEDKKRQIGFDFLMNLFCIVANLNNFPKTYSTTTPVWDNSDKRIWRRKYTRNRNSSRYDALLCKPEWPAFMLSMLKNLLG